MDDAALRLAPRRAPPASPSTAPRVDQRPDQSAGLERIADRHARPDRASAAAPARRRRSSWTNSRRSVVQRWPAVPIAAKAIARSARSRSARRRDDHRIVAAELEQAAAEARGDARAERAAHPRRAGRRDQRHARIVGQRLADLAAALDDLEQARRRVAEPLGGAREQRRARAAAQSGVFSDGFQTTLSPQTKARQAFQAQTATGKLKAEITPTTPSGCQVSIIRWPGRSVAMVRP